MYDKGIFIANQMKQQSMKVRTPTPIVQEPSIQGMGVANSFITASDDNLSIPESILTTNQAESPHIEGCEFATWNVNGLTNKASITDWVNFISSYEIICLQETWCVSLVHVEGYSSHFPAAIISQAGRAKGGLQTLISNKITVNVKKVATVGPHAQMLWLSKKGVKDLIIVHFYNNVFDSSRGNVVAALDHGLEFF